MTSLSDWLKSAFIKDAVCWSVAEGDAHVMGLKTKRFLASTAVISMAMNLVATDCAAQQYAWRTLAGESPGGADGIGTQAQFYYPWGITSDSGGNVYLADASNHTVRKVLTDGTVTTIAGKAGVLGAENGIGDNARFNSPAGVAVDSSGNIFVSDFANNSIRKITPTGEVSTLAGSLGPAGGSTDGIGSLARFRQPRGIAIDANGIIYVADGANHTIRKIHPNGTVSTLAGLAQTSGSSDGLGNQARFNIPSSICVSSSGDLFVTENNNHTIRKVTSDGNVTTVAGLAGQAGNINANGTSARFNIPSGICITASGDLYVTDYNNQLIRKISTAGDVTTFAGSASSWVDGPIGTARFAGPNGIAVTSSGEFFISDRFNFAIRKIGPDGTVSTLAGHPTWGDADGLGKNARFNFQAWGGAAIGPSGQLYIPDTFNFVIRQIDSQRQVTTIAGLKGVAAILDGPAMTARFYAMHGIACDALGNVYVSQANSHQIRKLSVDNQVTTVAGALNTFGTADGTGSAARFRSPIGLATDALNRLLIADRDNHAIRRMTPAGVVTTIAGTIGTSGTANGPALSASFNGPQSVAVDSNGLIYVADTNNHCIRRMTADGNVETFAGLAGTSGYVDGSATVARFISPAGVATDTSGNVYVSEGNARIRKITPSGQTTTIGGSIAGGGYLEGIGTAALLLGPTRIAVDNQGLVYVPDSSNTRILVGGVMPVQRIESALGAEISGSSSSLTYDSQMIGAANQTRQIVLRNNGTADLNVVLTKSGTDANSFTVSSPGNFAVPAGASTTLTITFVTAGTSGMRDANLLIASNDLFQNSLNVALNATAYSNTLDADSDGMTDWAEYKLVALGFDWQVANTAQVAALFANASAAGLYTVDQVQDLNVGIPLIQRNAATSDFTLTLGVEKSPNITSWLPFPMTAPQTLINGQGKLEFRFTVPDNASFFRIRAE